MPREESPVTAQGGQLGILGGTFDPVHLGHLRIARAALEEMGLQHVLFLPDGDPPHKQPHSSKEDRLRMLQLACGDDPRFLISDMELTRQGTTYTVDTLLALKKEKPRWELIYLVGSDTFLLFPSWHTAHRVARLCRMAILMRPTDDRAALEAARKEYGERYGLESRLLETPGLPLSSSMIREKARRGLPLTGLVPDSVAAYIAEKGLYAAPKFT